MPVGFGTWQISGAEECRRAVNWAIESGYRHIDTAQLYGNERYVGNAIVQQIKIGKLSRQDIQITTKIHPKNFGYRRTIRSLEKSLAALQTEYVDTLLLHFPMPVLRHGSWRALMDIQKHGKAKRIGVSNYTVRHLKQLQRRFGVSPAVNQVELHVYLQQPDLLEYCKAHDIVVEAYSPLAHGKGLNDPVLQAIGKKYGKTAAQIMLRWCLERRTVPLPKSTHQERIAQNIDILDFSLDRSDMQQITALHQNKRTLPNPAFIP